MVRPQRELAASDRFAGYRTTEAHIRPSSPQPTAPFCLPSARPSRPYVCWAFPYRCGRCSVCCFSDTRWRAVCQPLWPSWSGTGGVAAAAAATWVYPGALGHAASGGTGGSTRRSFHKSRLRSPSSGCNSTWYRPLRWCSPSSGSRCAPPYPFPTMAPEPGRAAMHGSGWQHWGNTPAGVVVPPRASGAMDGTGTAACPRRAHGVTTATACPRRLLRATDSLARCVELQALGPALPALRARRGV